MLDGDFIMGMKHLSIIIILILAVGCGYAIGYVTAPRGPSNLILAPTQCSALPYLIDNMELARDTHQDIVDNPERNAAWLRGDVDHKTWVDIYDELINILESF